MTNEDIVIQLQSTITWEPHVGRLLDAAAKEIERLRVVVSCYAASSKAACQEIKRLQMTAADACGEEPRMAYLLEEGADDSAGK